MNAGMGSSVTSDFRGFFSIPMYCIFSLSKAYINEKKSIVQEPKPFTSNYAVISLPDFLNDETRELNEIYDIDRGECELVNVCLSLSFFGFTCLVFICLLQNQTNYD